MGEGQTVTAEECHERHRELLEKLTAIEARLFRDNGTLSIQTRLDRHDLVIRALLWVVSLVTGTAVTLAVAAWFAMVRG